MLLWPISSLQTIFAYKIIKLWRLSSLYEQLQYKQHLTRFLIMLLFVSFSFFEWGDYAFNINQEMRHQNILCMQMISIDSRNVLIWYI